MKPSVNVKALRRYRNRLVTTLHEFASAPPPPEASTSQWLVHIYNYFNGQIQRFDLTTLTELVRQCITSKSVIYFDQMHLVVEQLLYRFIYYHRCTLQIYLSLSSTFIGLLRDGFQMPPEETEEDKDQEGPTAEGGPCGMGDGDIRKDAKDVSDQIESEDQLDEAKMPGQEQGEKEQNADEQQAVDEEQNGIEVSFDFEAAAEDPSKG